MEAVSLLRAQITGVHGLFTSTLKQIAPGEWAARPDPGANIIAFTAWHVPAVQDWALHTWMRGLPELRTGSDMAGRAGINPPLAPFGMSLEEADGIAAALAPTDVLAYAAAVQAAAMDLLDGLSEPDLDTIPDTRAHGTRLPQHRTPGYLAEVDDMYDMPVWRMLAGPCFGHAREHVGELRANLTLMRARG
jgi:DinB superfamily